MPTYELIATRRFKDAKTGEFYEAGDEFVVQDKSRAISALGQKLCFLRRIVHEKKSGKAVIFAQSFANKIGGIEALALNLAEAFKDNNLTFIFGKADENLMMELGETCDVAIFESGEGYKADTIITTGYDSDWFKKHCDYKEEIKLVHCDYRELNKILTNRVLFNGDMDDRTRLCAVSKTAQDGLEAVYGLKSDILPNFVAKVPKKALTFVVMSRATKEKGIDEVIKFHDRLVNAGKDFVILLATDKAQEFAEAINARERIIHIKPSIYAKALLRSADYLIQLSKTESWCYSVHEALAMGIPVIVSKIPEFKEVVKDGKNGYFYDERTGIEKIFNKIPKFKAEEMAIPKEWSEIMEAIDE